MSGALLELAGVSKRFSLRTDRRLRYALGDVLRELRGLPPEDGLRDGEFWALREVDLRVDPGEAVGLIGHNGAGKSTLMQIAAGILLPTTGSVTVRSRDVCRIDSAGVVSPVETGRENILMQLALHRIPPAETEAEIEAIAAIADLGDRLDQEVGTYSTGMRGRLAFAIFARLRPELMLVDEGIGGGDRRFRERFRGFLEDYLGEGGAMLFAMHDTNAITTLCDRVAVIEAGRLVTTAEPATAIDAYNELAAQKGLPPMPKPRPVRHPGKPRDLPRAAEAGGDPGIAVEVARVGDAPLRPGGPVELVITVTASEPVAEVRCIIEIGRGELFPLARLRRRLDALAAGVTTVRCTIAAWPLVAGRGELQVRLFQGESRRIIARSETLVVQVGRTDDGRPDSRAIVHVDAAWGEPSSGESDR